ncbi:MAG: hypothetical protein CMM18_00805 [Rhodospirillaceae bacterium]|nr:hypothetical protein [Rhodospirillaceae bacterium]|tara:strand:+ start:60 stop:656 length:597 start_codon:yes stop_codon:yes gene_type:complete
MSKTKRIISIEDILHPESYKKVRKEKKVKMVEIKKVRRLSVGPYATFYFENYETIWHQIHEMIFIEKGGFTQAKEEISAYKNLVPNGSELIATLMFEIDSKSDREVFLKKVSGIEKYIYITIGKERILAISEDDINRTRNDGKTSAVHFLHFNLSKEQINSFKNMGNKVTLSFGHPEYSYSHKIENNLKNSLLGDLDY